jgi:hypothetical protein
LASEVIDAEISHVPVPLVTVIEPVEVPTEHAVDDPAEYETVPPPRLAATTTFPVSP